MNQIKLLLLACALFGQGLFGMQKSQEPKQAMQKQRSLGLYGAYIRKDLPAFREALAEGADVNAEVQDGVTLLFLICKHYARLPDYHKGDALREKQLETGEFIKLLLAHPKLNINHQARYSGEVILFEMAFAADEAHIKLALAIPGIDVNIKRDDSQDTVLNHVVWRLHDALEWRRQFKDIQQCERAYASKQKMFGGPPEEPTEAYKSIVKLLLEHGADPAIKDERGINSYDQARGDSEILKLLQDGRAAYLKKLKEMQATVVQPVHESTALFMPLCELISELAVGPDEVYASGQVAERVGAGSAGSAGAAGASSVELKREAGKQ